MNIFSNVLQWKVGSPGGLVLLIGFWAGIAALVHYTSRWRRP